MTGGTYGPRRPLPRQGSMTGYFKSPYLANLAGVPDARGHWIESNAGMSHDGGAGSKVTLACRMTGPLDRK